MGIIRLSVDQPVTVTVGVILLLLFGLISLQLIPIQLSPSVDEPEITVTTVWPGATPYEVERDIIEEQEEVLKGVRNLRKMEGTASNGQGQISLTFDIGTDIDNALLRVSNKLDEVPRYPENVDRPVINASGAQASPVVWIMLQTLEGNDRDIWTYRTYLENEVRQFLDRVDGVSDLFIGGGVETEMHVKVDPEALASYQLTIDQVVEALRSGNANVSAGRLGVGRREFRVRSVAEYRNTEDIEALVIVSDGQRIVRVGDVADVVYGYQKHETPVISGRDKAIAIGVRPQPGTNILDLTDAVEQVVLDLNEEMLRDQGLELTIVNEQRPYIRGAIELLQQNIAIGGALAITVLLLFLRKLAPTLVVAVAIPISIIGTFMAMYAFGTTLNVVSLAGIAFAVGMLVDNAIVVLENIDRHHNMGKSAYRAAMDGTREVWGAVLASTLTTIAVFLPVVFLEDEAGQLFNDIAIAVTSAVGLSLLVSMTVIPMLSRQLFGFMDRRAVRSARKENGKGRAKHDETDGPEQAAERKPSRLGGLARAGSAIADGLMGVIHLATRNVVTRLATILLLVGGAVGSAYLLLPKMEYLPQGNRDLIINILIPPPGLSFEERTQIGETLFAFMEPYRAEEKDGYPRVRHMFYVGRQNLMVFGVISANQARTRELIPLSQEALGLIPGVFGISNQASIFEQGIGEGRTIEVNFQGNDINQLVQAAGAAFGQIRGAIPDVQVRPLPSLDLLFPEANFVPSYELLQAVGMSAEQFGIGLDVLMDGREIGEFKQPGEKKIDLVVKVAESDIRSPEELYEALVATPVGETVQVSSLSDLEKTTGLTEIRHLERERTMTLQVTPPYEVTIQEAMETIETGIIPQLEAQGVMEGVDVTMTGTADKLTQTRQALQWNIALAALISYLLMAALLSNFVYPLVIMVVIPLAGAGGLIGLRLLDAFIVPQQLDIVTMLGFIILIGVTVNNPILIVYQALLNIREQDMPHREAVLEAARSRIRPIYMSATTSLLGMAPLVFFPGPGSELYRGLGSVILGGLALSTVFTLLLVPSMLLFFLKMEDWRKANQEAVAKDEAAAKGAGRPEEAYVK